MFSCKEDIKAFRYKGSTMGTTYSVIVNTSSSSLTEKQIGTVISSELSRVSGKFSPFNKESEVSKVNFSSRGKWIPISKEVAELISRSVEISGASSGSFDVTVGPLINLFGFGPKKYGKMPSADDVKRTMKFTGYENIQVRLQPPSIKKRYDEVRVNLSAIAKGYGVDRVAELLEKEGIKSYMVEVGGEVRTGTRPSSERKWRIGLPVPENMSRKILKVIESEKISMATSGEYNNFRIVNGKEISHTVDPATGYPVKHRVSSVTVFHESCMTADAYATAINVMGPERGMKFANKMGVAVLLVVKEGEKYNILTNRKFDLIIEKKGV